MNNLHMDNLCPDCGHELSIGDFPFCPHGRVSRHYNSPSVSSCERAVVYRHPLTGKIAYPPRNDLPMPERYQKAGFERVELSTLRSVEQFERDNSVRNAKAWYDSKDTPEPADPPDLTPEAKQLIREGKVGVKLKDA